MPLNERNQSFESLLSVVTDSERLVFSRGWGVYGEAMSRHRLVFFSSLLLS